MTPPPAGVNRFFVDYAAFNQRCTEALKLGFKITDWVDAEMLHTDYPHLSAAESRRRSASPQPGACA